MPLRALNVALRSLSDLAPKDGATEASSTMKAFKLVEWGQPGQYVDAPKPTPGTNDVLIRVKAVGLCRSDLDMVDSKPGSKPYASGLEAGYILGHETAGFVEQLGNGVVDLMLGDSVAVHHMRHCGNCNFCMASTEQHCEFFYRGDSYLTRGCGMDGGLAEFLVVPRSEVISLGSHDPVLYAPLTDAGVTAYHGIQKIAHRIRPGDTAAVFAIDKVQRPLQTALGLGADEVLLSNEESVRNIKSKTDGMGINYIIDFVGSDQTLMLAAEISRPQGAIVVVGMEGGSVSLGWNRFATNCDFSLSLGSTRKDLQEVCQLLSDGKLGIDIQRFAFGQIQAAYDALRNGDVLGRPVVVLD